MDWFSQLSDSVSSVYDNTVKTGTDYFNTRISGFNRDPAPVQTTGNVGGRGENSITKTAENAGMFGYSWSAIAAMAGVLVAIILLIRK